jgi:hypothetical protein
MAGRQAGRQAGGQADRRTGGWVAGMSHSYMDGDKDIAALAQEELWSEPACLS